MFNQQSIEEEFQSKYTSNYMTANEEKIKMYVKRRFCKYQINNFYNC